MIKNWQIFNENNQNFRYSESDLFEIISDLVDDDLVQDLKFEMFYYNKGQHLAREKYKLVDPKWENKPLYMFIMTLKSPGEFIPVQGIYFDDIESFKKIYQILEGVKSWATKENITFLHQFNDTRKLRIIFIQND
jgi:hypothetical protein